MESKRHRIIAHYLAAFTILFFYNTILYYITNIYIHTYMHIYYTT